MNLKPSIENCRIVAFNVEDGAEGRKYYRIGILQGRECCEMLSCEEKLGQAFDTKTMFDKLCRIGYKQVDTKNGGSWIVVTDIDFIKTQNESK